MVGEETIFGFLSTASDGGPVGSPTFMSMAFPWIFYFFKMNALLYALT